VSVNASLRVAMYRGAGMKMVAENWDYLQVRRWGGGGGKVPPVWSVLAPLPMNPPPHPIVEPSVVVAGLINGDLPGLPLALKSKRPIRGLAQVRWTMGGGAGAPECVPVPSL